VYISKVQERDLDAYMVEKKKREMLESGGGRKGGELEGVDRQG
jgi:hypothetical protein